MLNLCLPFSTKAQSEAPIQVWKETEIRRPKVTLTPYLPEQGGDGTAVIICPGGSYFWIDRKTEGEDVARWLQSNGIAAFVLHYGVAGFWSYFSHDRLFCRKHQHPDMLEDVQRAIQLVRENAEALGVDPAKTGVMGFSAGGHLALSSGVFAGTDFLAPHGIESRVSLRPDFIASIYPVVTMSDRRYAHRRSRRGLLGEWRKGKEMFRDSMSLEKHIPDDMPPVFLMNCEDDPVVKYQNSELMDSALTAKGINHTYIQYKTGGHGFGATAEKTTDEAISWCDRFLDWIKTICQ